MDMLPKLNKSLLRRVLKHIKNEPRRLFMGDWARDNDELPCGTQACLGGWTYIIGKGNTKRIRGKAKGSMYDRVEETAQYLLGLTDEEARALFLTYMRDTGEKGVKRAEAKINLLLRDREKFVERYGG